MTLNLHITSVPADPHFAEFCYDPNVAGIRMNGLLFKSCNLDEELAKIPRFPSVPLWFDAKGRQLRVEEAIYYKDHLELVMNHGIKGLSLPHPIIFKAGEDWAMVEKITDENKRLILRSDGYPKYRVKPGDSVHFRDTGFEIDGPLFTDDEKAKIERAVKAGAQNWYLSYVENRYDVEDFRELIGSQAKLVQGGSTTLSQDPFERFGVVDFGGNDVDVVSKTNAAVSWLRDVKKDGWSWNPYKPQRDEMFPNMCVSSDISSNVKEAKEAVSQRIGEISQVWMCGVAARKHAHSQGVKSWKDDRCTSQILGFRDGKISKTLDAILNFNRRCLSLPKKSTVEQKIYVDRETISSDVVVTTPCANEFFIDFEMAGDIGVSRNAKPIIFMIGVSHNLTTPNGCSIKKSKRNKRSGKHTSVVFSTSEMEWKNESDVCEKFVKYISTHSVVNKPIRVFHWSSTERWRWDKFCKIATPRLQRVIARSQIEFVDMYEIFKRNNIVIEGCLDYKLKNIAKKMWELGLIETTWPKEGVTDGFGATVELQNALDGGDIVKINNVIESIETYNKVDVNVLREMMNCIRRL
jgi:hypothetical protein